MTPSDVQEVHTVAEEGERADAWAARVFTGIASKAAARKRLRSGRLVFDGARIESSRFVRVGMRAELYVPATVPACGLEPDVLFADDHVAVVYKPAGVLVNGNRHRTLEHGLPNVLARSPLADALVRPRPVHRLDYETAGPVAVARTHQAMVAWSRAFEDRQVDKRYEAVVLGRLEDAVVVELPVEGRTACSRIEPLATFRSLRTDWCTHVALVPVTGRRHQLRQHCLAIGHPILGDRRYRTGPAYLGKGLFLAATHLALPHPVDDTRVAFDAPVPAKFRSFRAREERRWRRWHGSPRP
jgi:23S rRNA pseudouridine1911/1915/1917 synthase